MAVKERHGVCRWLEPDRVLGERVLQIDGHEYNVRRVRADSVVYYRLYRLDATTFDIRSYSVIPGEGGWSCSCPDAQNGHPGQCKHCRALQAALKARPY